MSTTAAQIAHLARDERKAEEDARRYHKAGDHRVAVRARAAADEFADAMADIRDALTHRRVA